MIAVPQPRRWKNSACRSGSASLVICCASWWFGKKTSTCGNSFSSRLTYSPGKGMAMSSTVRTPRRRAAANTGTSSSCRIPGISR